MLITLLSMASVSTKKPTPNVLHLMDDDMRPQLNCYGQEYMRTPNLDKLAAEGLLFDSAYTQFAYCAPSRNSLLTGRRPERTRNLNFLSDFRQTHGDAWVSMPQARPPHTVPATPLVLVTPPLVALLAALQELGLLHVRGW